MFDKKRTHIHLFVFFAFYVSMCNPNNFFVHRAGFEELADHVYDPINDDLSYKNKKATFDPKYVKYKDIIFVRRNSLNDFFNNMHQEINNPYILISHVDDPDFDYKYYNYLEDSKIIACFGINPGFSFHKKFIAIPIGINQAEHIWEKKTLLTKTFNHLRSISKDKLLYLNYSDESSFDRVIVRNIFVEKKFCFVDIKKPFLDYLTTMAQFKFVLSPRGFGQDCYRTWEALLVGAIPIVKSSYLDVLYSDLPVLIINDWGDINEGFLNRKYREITSKKYNFSKLYLSYWIEKILKVKNNF